MGQDGNMVLRILKWGQIVTKNTKFKKKEKSFPLGIWQEALSSAPV